MAKCIVEALVGAGLQILPVSKNNCVSNGGEAQPVSKTQVCRLYQEKRESSRVVGVGLHCGDLSWFCLRCLGGCDARRYSRFRVRLNHNSS